MSKSYLGRVVLRLFIFLVAVLGGTGAYAGEVAMRAVGEPGNAADKQFHRLGRGAVKYIYRISENLVSNSEYASFLSAVDKGGDKGFYDPSMAITREGAKGSYTYRAKSGKGDAPVTSVTYAEAAEFCNWLSGGQVYGIVDGQVRRRMITGSEGSEVYFIPNHDELYKANYYKGDGKYKYEKSEIAEMTETRRHAWHRVAFGHAGKPETFIRINNYTNNVTGKSEDNVRNSKVGFRVASMPLVHFNPALKEKYNIIAPGTVGIEPTIRSAKAGEAQVEWKILDYWGKDVSGATSKLKLSKGVNNLKFGEKKLQQGYYRFIGQITQSGKVVSNFEIPFTALAPIAIKPEAKSPFGVCVHLDRMYNMWGRMAPSEYKDLIINAGISWVRPDLPDPKFTLPFTEEGVRVLSFFPFVYNYRNYDSPYSDPARNKKWQSLDIAPELYGYADRCEKLIKNNPHVKHWEVGNEPHGWKISPGDYAQLVKTAYKVAKATDPETKVIIGDMEHINVSVISKYHADKFADAVAIHTYGFFKDYFMGVISRVRDLRRALAANGDKNKPVWTTELGGCGYWNHIFPGMTEEERFRYQALDLPKKMAGSLGLGVEKVFYYEFAETEVKGTEQEFGIVSKFLIPKPAYTSYRVTVEQLHGREFSGWLDLGKPELTGMEFSGADDKCYLIWREDKPATLERRVRIDLPMIEISAPEFITVKSDKDMVLTDIMGVKTVLASNGGQVKIPVSEYPVFVSGNGEFKHQDLFKLGDVEENPVTDKNAVAVQIIPPFSQMRGWNDLHNMQLATRLELIRQKDQTFEVRLFNLTDEEISGRVYLRPPMSNSDAGWVIKEKYDNITIKPNSTRTVKFTVNIPKRPNISELAYILKAVFESGDREYIGDAIVKQIRNNEIGLKSGDKLGFEKNKKFVRNFALKHKNTTGVKSGYAGEGSKEFYIKWSKPRNKFVEFEVKSKPVIGDLSGKSFIAIACKAERSAGVAKLSARLIDKDGEIFQYKGRGLKSNGKFNIVKFPISQSSYSGSWGGNKNGKLDTPVRLKSFVVDFSSQEGEANFKAPVLVKN